MSKIPWTEETWNPVVGCTKIAAGCKNCYAERMARRFWKQWGLLAPPHHFGVKWFIDRLEEPLHWKKPRKIFVCSMSDLFHESVPFEFISKVIMSINITPQHTYQILTKRPERMLEYFKFYIKTVKEFFGDCKPLHKRLWLGTSISKQTDADKNIPILLQLPAAVRFLSIEPLLPGRINLRLRDCINCEEYIEGPLADCSKCHDIDWVIIGAESGPKARLCSLEDIDYVIDQCRSAGMPVFLKQIPLNGRCEKDPSKWPQKYQGPDLRRFPKGMEN